MGGGRGPSLPYLAVLVDADDNASKEQDNVQIRFRLPLLIGISE